MILNNAGVIVQYSTLIQHRCDLECALPTAASFKLRLSYNSVMALSVLIKSDANMKIAGEGSVNVNMAGVKRKNKTLLAIRIGYYLLFSVRRPGIQFRP